jgi:hypothetical protein
VKVSQSTLNFPFFAYRRILLVSCPTEGPDAQIVVTKISPVKGLWASATGA